MSSTSALEHRVVRACNSTTLRQIEDLFIFAGAEAEWRGAPPAAWSNRQDAARAWIAGIKTHAPERLTSILLNVLHQLDEEPPRSDAHPEPTLPPASSHRLVPDEITSLLDILIKGIVRAMLPLARRRVGKTCITLSDEYDVQDLFHSLLRPWVGDIRPEEYTPSYASGSTRIDLLLKRYAILVEIKFVRSRAHAAKIHQEITIDIAQYRQHPDAQHLWVIVYDPAGRGSFRRCGNGRKAVTPFG